MNINPAFPGLRLHFIRAVALRPARGGERPIDRGQPAREIGSPMLLPGLHLLEERAMKLKACAKPAPPLLEARGWGVQSTREPVFREHNTGSPSHRNRPARW